jgi:hypothetical protein
MDSLLQNAGELGLSIKQLSKLTNKSVKCVKYFIAISDHIDHANPLLHGSCKVRTHVYKWNIKSKKDKYLKTPELLV